MRPPEVLDITESSNFNVSDGMISYEMDPKTVSLLVISKNKNFSSEQSEKTGGALWLMIGADAVVLVGSAIAALKIKKKKS